MASIYTTTLLAIVCAPVLQAAPTAEVSLILPKQVQAGTSTEVALEFAPAKDLHVYYINPGEMGQAVALKWQELPEGIDFGELRFPIPHRIKTGDLPTNGYEELTHFFTELTLSAEVAPGEYPLQANVSWLACDDSKCMVGKQALTVNLVVGTEGTTTVVSSPDLQKALQQVPVDASAEWSSEVRKEGENWVIDLTAPADWKDADQVADIFSETTDFFQPGVLPEITKNEKGLRISVPASEYSKDLKTADIVLAGPTPPLRLALALPTKK